MEGGASCPDDLENVWKPDWTANYCPGQLEQPGDSDHFLVDPVTATNYPEKIQVYFSI